MPLLILFAVLAGAGTALTPCVLPVLPALLSASATGGRRRPLGVVLGLMVTHTLVIVALGSLINRVGLADGFVRTFAIARAARLRAVAAPALARGPDRGAAQPARALRPALGGNGFWSGVGVGGALGFVYAPCAGPILAAVISVGATQGSSLELVAVARRLRRRLRGHPRPDRLRRAARRSSACAAPAAAPAFSGRSAR